MNVWDNIRAAQIAHDLIHRESDSGNIADYDPSCIYCAGDNKARTRNYKNFLIYLTNHYQLTDATDETNLAFEKLSRRLEVLIQESEEETDTETAKSARKNAEEIFETVRFSKTPKTSFNDTVSILIGVAYGTNIFDNARNIELAHQLAYQQVIKDGNYLELSEEETITELINYIEKTPYLKLSSKGKEKAGDITPLILPTGTIGSVSPILPAYTQQITLPDFQPRSESSFLSSWFGNSNQSSAFQQPAYNFNYNIMSGYNQNYYRDPYGYGYIQRPPTYNYAGYYQPSHFGPPPVQQNWGQTPVATTLPLRVVTSQPTQNTQTTTQPTQTTNVIIPPQNTTTTQTQNTTTLPNILNLTSQPTGTTGATAGGSGSQSNATSNVNTGGGHFPHFGTIGANPIGGFGAFGSNNNNPPPGNNNNNNPPPLPPLPPPGFGGGLGGGFNPPPGGNAGGLDPNVAALVNALTGANLGVNHVDRESNHVKPTEFGGTEVEDPNEWLERYNRIAEANKWSEHRRFQIIGGYLVGAAARWYDEIKTFITSWGYFQHVFLTKFASPARKNTWYLKYKSCKQAGPIKN